MKMQTKYELLPEDLQGSFERYLEKRIPTGGFLDAVLCNDLRAACERADEINKYRLFDIVFWLYNNAPIGSWGSPENVREWLKRD